MLRKILETSVLAVLAAACGGSGTSGGFPADMPQLTGGAMPSVPAATAGTTGALPPATPTGMPTNTSPSRPTGTGAAGTGAPTGTTTNNMPPATGAAGGGAPTVTDTSCPTCAIPPECRGFSFAGLKYSPGGTTLPNKCMPYDATKNNPYAVRCIDALPGFKTKYPGDEYCILPPPPEMGFQVGLHPHGNTAAYWAKTWAGDFSGYETPKAEWELKAGGEITQNFRTRDAPMKETTKYYRTYFRMRTGSHHMIVTMHESAEADGWIPGGGEALPGLLDPTSGAINGILGGEQRPDDNTPVSLEKPAEDDGLYLNFPADPSIIFNMHHFNSTDGPLLREGWINIWKEEDARNVVSWYMGLEFGQVVSLSVAPGGTADLHYSWNVGSDLRLIRVFGHRHFWTTNFSTWVKRANNGPVELLYQSYDWFDMPTYRYDSVAKNPMLDPTKGTDGAVSGIVQLKAGDQLHFNCHIEFTDARAATDPNAPKPSEIGRLRFANEAYHGEMCIQFGNVTGGGLGLPAVNSSPLPDFAKMGAGGAK